MTSETRRQSSIDERPPPNRGAAGRRHPAQTRLLIALVVVLLVGSGIVFRHAIVRNIVIGLASALTGDRIAAGDIRLGLRHAVVTGLIVRTAGNEPLLRARRIELTFAPAAGLRARDPRAALRSIDIASPVLSIVRGADGKYNVGGSKSGAAPASAPAPVTRWNLIVRVRDGQVDLIDRAPIAADLRRQRIVGISLEAAVRPDTAGSLHGRAVFEGRVAADAGLRAWPIVLGGRVDYPRGLGVARITAAELPLRGPIGFLQHSAAVRVDAGIVRHAAVEVFALDIEPDRPVQLDVAGSADVADARLSFGALLRPVRGLHGHLVLDGDGIWTRRLDGSLAGIPIHARGGAYDRAAPTLRLGIRGGGDLADLRAAFAFSRAQPVRGKADIQTLVEAPIAGILIRTQLRVPRGRYAAAGLTDVHGQIDYHAGAVVVDGATGRYGAAAVGVGGRFVLGGRHTDARIVATAAAPGRALPYAENLAPASNVDITAVFDGGPRGYGVHGALSVAGGTTAGSGTFHIDERGRGEFGPLALRRSAGSSLVGALRLERPISRSAAWLDVHDFPVAVSRPGARLPGIATPAFPPVAGVLDGAIVGAGPPSAFALAGVLRGRDLRVAGAPLGTGRVALGGTLADLRLSGLRVAGPTGTFSGSGAAARGRFALRGDYRGTLDDLVPLTGHQEAHGAVRGQVLAAIDAAGIVVQSPRADLTNGRVRGVALGAAAGTIAVRANRFHLIAATGSIAGSRAVAAESSNGIAVSAPDLPVAALRGAGVALDRGRVSAYGLAQLGSSAPVRFIGTVAVTDGAARGVPIAGNADVALDGPHLRITDARGALGSTFGRLGGSLDGIGAGAVRYDVRTAVALGEIAGITRELPVRVRHLDGSFTADMHITGAGDRPRIDGQIEIPEGSIEGLAFRDAGARVDFEPDRRLRASGARVTIGSTRLALAALVAPGTLALSVRAPSADLTDFNDFFDVGDQLAGRGAVDLDLRTGGGHIASDGDVDLRDLRFRTYALGDTRATWRTTGSRLAARAILHSPAGSLALTGSVVPHGGGSPMALVRSADYAAQATLSGIDIATWLAAAGVDPIASGRADARLSVAGRYPRLAAHADAALNDAVIEREPVRHAHLLASSLGSRIDVAESDADLGFAQLTGSGRLGLAPADPLDFNLRVTTGDVAPAISRFIPASRGRTAGGRLDADLQVRGTRAKPAVAGGFDLEGGRYAGLTVPRVIGEFALGQNSVELEHVDVELTRGSAFVAGSLPLLIAPFGLGPPRAPLSFDVTASDVDLAQFTPIAPAGTTIGGIVNGRFGVDGTVEEPRLYGSLGVRDGTVVAPWEREPIDNIAASLTFSGTTVTLASLHAGLGHGSLDGSGRLTLPSRRQRATGYSAHVVARAATLDVPALGRGTVDAQLDITGRGSRPALTGEVTIRDAVIPVSAVYGAEAAGAAGGTIAPGLDPTLNLQVVAGSNVRLRSPIVDIGIAGSVDAAGTLSAPVLGGTFVATDGTISSYNHLFRIINATVAFDPADGAVPTVHARASARVQNPDPDPSRNIAGSATIYVTVSGTADQNNLQVTYSSDPAYSQEQIVGLLLDIPALLKAVNFSLNAGPGSPLLRGAPGESNVLLPPGVTPQQVSAVSFNEEVFSLLNGQFAQRALTPVERVFQQALGLSDVEFTVDYGGGIGYSLRRQIGKRDFYAFLSQTVTYPERANVGFELVPKPNESVNFSVYAQNGVTSLITNATPGEELYRAGGRLTSVQPLGNRAGVSLSLTRRF